MLVRVHKWTGVALAVWVAVTCLSGILLVWKDDYYAFRYPSLPDTGVLIEPSAGAIERIIADSVESIQFLGMPTKSLPAYHAYYVNGDEALLHPATGDVVARWGYLDALPGFLFELHVNLLLSDFGHQVVGWLGVLLMLNIVIGFWLWLRKRKIFKLKFALPKLLSKPALLRAHAAQGSILSSAFVIIVFSGTAIVFAGPVQSAFNSAFGASGELRPTALTLESGHDEVDWSAVLTASDRALPSAQLRLIYLPAQAHHAIILRLRNVGELHPNGRSYVVASPSGGVALQTIDATSTGLGPTIFNLLYPLHAGKTGWPGYRLLLSLLGASLLFIAIVGAGLFLTRPGSHKKVTGKQSVTPSTS
ncbi:MAG: PepSY-associated TM helix domain-containing protein [Pseudomonadota bacterium]